MHFNDHSTREGTHAYLSASNSFWAEYDDDKFDRVFYSKQEAIRGTKLHALAKNLIELGVKLEPIPTTLNMYVNDCIGFGMTPEQMVFYSEWAYGTPDAIKFEMMKLWIFDLKTGVEEAKMRQLLIYAAWFCLEYGYLPHEIEIELRIYQNDNIVVHAPAPHEVQILMDLTRDRSKRLTAIMREVLG